jgi:hypothetical protein
MAQSRNQRGAAAAAAAATAAAAAAKRNQEIAEERVRREERERDAADQENIDNVNNDRRQQQQQRARQNTQPPGQSHPATVSTRGNTTALSDLSTTSTTVTYPKTAKGAASFYGDHGAGYNAAISRKIIEDLTRGALFKKKKFINSEQELNDFGRNSMGVFMATTLHIKKSTAKEWWLLHKQIVARAISIKRNNCNSDMKVVIISKFQNNQGQQNKTFAN